MKPTSSVDHFHHKLFPVFFYFRFTGFSIFNVFEVFHNFDKSSSCSLSPLVSSLLEIIIFWHNWRWTSSIELLIVKHLDTFPNGIRARRITRMWRLYRGRVELDWCRFNLHKVENPLLHSKFFKSNSNENGNVMNNES